MEMGCGRINANNLLHKGNENLVGYRPEKFGGVVIIAFNCEVPRSTLIMRLCRA